MTHLDLDTILHPTDDTGPAFTVIHGELVREFFPDLYEQGIRTVEVHKDGSVYIPEEVDDEGDEGDE